MDEFEAALALTIKWLTFLANGSKYGHLSRLTIRRCIEHLKELRQVASDLGLSQIVTKADQITALIESTTLSGVFASSYSTKLICIIDDLKENNHVG